MGWFGKKKPETVTHRQEFTLKHPPREARMDAVTAIDNALAQKGQSEVMHAIDPGRIASFADGGPPVWSVATTDVGGRQPFALFVTYGFSHAICPDDRQGVDFEFSIAVDKRSPSHPWAVALLRHLCRYQRTSGNELMVGDVMPCHAPITCIPFPPQHHAMMPPTELDSVIVVDDPTLPTITTPHGAIRVRRIVGCTMDDLRAIGPQPPAQRAAALAQQNPGFITTL